MSDEEKNSSNLKNYVSSLIVVGKDVVTLLRDSALFLFALLLLVFPNAFNTILTKAGFDERSFAGFKWKGKLVNSDSALKEARASITELKSQLDKTSKALEDATSNNPALKNSLAKL